MILEFDTSAQRNAHIYDRFESGEWTLIFVPTREETEYLDQLISGFFIDIKNDRMAEKFANGAALFIHRDEVSVDRLADYIALDPDKKLFAESVRNRDSRLHMYAYYEHVLESRIMMLAISTIINEEASRRTGEPAEGVILDVVESN